MMHGTTNIKNEAGVLTTWKRRTFQKKILTPNCYLATLR